MAGDSQGICQFFYLGGPVVTGRTAVDHNRRDPDIPARGREPMEKEQERMAAFAAGQHNREMIVRSYPPSGTDIPFDPGFDINSQVFPAEIPS
nr:hypothetical protein [uncultured Methanoregula sp.]